MANRRVVKGRIPSAYAGSDEDQKSTVTERILNALSHGHTRRAAAAYGGVTYTTFRRWMLEDEDLVQAVEIAEAVPERLAVSELMKAVQAGDLRAIEFWLERRRPMDFGRVDRMDVMVRRAQMEEAAQMLSKELGREVSLAEVQESYQKALKALPAGRKRNSAV